GNDDLVCRWFASAQHIGGLERASFPIRSSESRAMSSAFIQAAVMLLREGLEAMLVIAALAAYLTKGGGADRGRALYAGALAAVVVSIVAAWLFAVLNSGQHSDLFEGVIILFAAALMLYVSGWLMVKQDPHGWKDYLAAKADNALAQDTAWAVAALA